MKKAPLSSSLPKNFKIKEALSSFFFVFIIGNFEKRAREKKLFKSFSLAQSIDQSPLLLFPASLKRGIALAECLKRKRNALVEP